MEKREVSEYVLSKTYTLFCKYWFCFVKVAAVFLIPLLILNEYFWGNQILIDGIIDKFSLVAFVVIDDIINFIIFLFLLLYLAALTKAIHTADVGEKPGAVSSYRQALNIFGPYLWVKTLSLFKVLCWTLLFIVPGIVAGIFYSFSGMALVVGGKRGKEALTFSWDITRPNIKKYLLHVLSMSAFLLVACTAIILYFDSVLVFLELRGQFFWADVVDYFEIGFVVMSGIFGLVFFYYLYRELSEDAQMF